MADAKKKPAGAKGAKPDKGKKSKKGGGKLGLYTTLVVVGFAAPFMLPTMILLLAGMLPTLIAFFIDKDRQHSSAIAIGAMNFAGLTPFLIDTLIKGQSMGNVFQILSDPSSWLIVLGAAAIGQMIVSVVPQALATLTLAHSELRIKTLKNNLEQLRNRWGPDVGTTKPIDSLTHAD
jgi:hypothetical protein